MNLRSYYPYWLLRHGIINNYPSLASDVKADVAIIGAGISGALVAWHLCKAGFSVVVADRRHVGWGSTAASTSLLQYEIDTPLYELKEKTGEENAIKSYLLCREAIYKLETICRQFNDKELFEFKPSLQFASFKSHVADLKKEYELRKKIGFSLEFLDEKNVVEKYGFSKPAALLSKDGAEADAYKITHRLFEKCIPLGLRLYDHTEITNIIHHKKGVELITPDKKKIHARYLVIACGYESQRYIPYKVETLESTYAAISEPFSQKHFWYKNSLIWETASPYLYIRTTADNRIIIGGKDVPFTNPDKRDELLPAKTKALERSFSKLFPALQFKTDFKWAGSFASTKDGLPFIGSIRQRPHSFFALGFGGNGITFSMIAAEIIRDLLTGKNNPHARIFSFDR
jgi:glycine/D-amino acid oxidase-like deaminating enzyme